MAGDAALVKRPEISDEEQQRLLAEWEDRRVHGELSLSDIASSARLAELTGKVLVASISIPDSASSSAEPKRNKRLGRVKKRASWRSKRGGARG
jgi:hypothetical protein